MGQIRLMRRVGCAAVIAVCAAVSVPGVSTFAQQPPRFQASIDVTRIDVAVVDDHGKPITDLAPADFVVRVDGSTRRVVSAEWIPLATPETRATPPAPPPDGYSTNETASGGRLIVIAIDEPNIRFGGALGISRAANAFIDRLSPADRIAVASFGTGAPPTVFTADRARVKQAISRLAGQKRSNRINDLGHNIAVVEAMAIDKGDRATLDLVQQRECLTTGAGLAIVQLEMCKAQVEMEAHALAQEIIREGDQSIQALRDLFTGLRTIDAPKTMILISEGFVMNDEGLVIELGRMAAEARTSIYALRLDNQAFDIETSRMPTNPFADRQARAEGLETLAGAARGTIFTVATAEAPFFARIESELSGYYLLGVESDPRDRDGKIHPIRVDVPRRGAIVRSRRQLLNAPADARENRSPRQAAAAALTSPLLSSALPLRVASFSLQGPEHDKVQLLIHADVGTDYPASKPVALAYVIIDQNGRVVDSRAESSRLLPVMNGVPSPLQYAAGASIPPGEYLLKLAAAEGDRVGTVEHPIHAALTEASGVTLSELMVGGPADVGELLRPTIGYTASFGSVHGYLEAYGSQAEVVTVKYEIAADQKAPALLNADVQGRLSGDDRVIFSRVIPVPQLPPGKYVLRAIVSAAGKPVKTVARGFEVAAPKVLMTSADGLGATSVDAELFLPVDDGVLTPTFERAHATLDETLQPFKSRVADHLKPSFDQGVALFGAGDYVKAELSFKKTIDPDADSTAGLAYLAASFAASGHDIEAASAWQTALVDGSDLPQIYDWLAGALMRKHDYAEARTVLEEALSKWPGDVRFIRPLAMIYATFGRGREAVRTLERYLEAEPGDVEALYHAVEWLYHVHSAGAVVHSRAEDVKLARNYAAAYEKARGTQVPLVKQWVDYLAAEKE